MLISEIDLKIFFQTVLLSFDIKVIIALSSELAVIPSFPNIINFFV